MLELKLLLFSIVYERKLDYRIIDKKVINVDGIIILFLDGRDGKFYVINFV